MLPNLYIIGYTLKLLRKFIMMDNKWWLSKSLL